MRLNEKSTELVIIPLMFVLKAFAPAQGPVAAPAPPAQRDGALSDRAVVCGARRQEMRRALQGTHERQRNIGLSAVVMLGGELVLSEGLGYADLEHRISSPK